FRAAFSRNRRLGVGNLREHVGPRRHDRQKERRLPAPDRRLPGQDEGRARHAAGAGSGRPAHCDAVDTLSLPRAVGFLPCRSFLWEEAHRKCALSATYDPDRLRKHSKMGQSMQKIMPCLWFDNNAEEAVNFYISVFKDGKIESIARYGEAGPGPKGS